MGLDEEPGFLFFGFLQCIAGFNSLCTARFEVLKLSDSDAVRTGATEIRQAVGDWLLQTIHGSRNHAGQSVFTRSRWSREDDSVWKPLMGQHAANCQHRIGVAVKIGKRHVE